ncbi:hypothetical protein CERSUDRAFT_110343 [Gelatoporia subvermispora B]|uniref:INO80 complex subunit B-like conserved region domain-containing protein n=1 Tax=Ceriporiopsis subvermispora (strain B) TaxID=914234 RepID=M2RS71_CERS8|nr:hypothetical protein CERSUDRAFT_110343 [Gelatoporia subvermispora B]
MPPRRRIVSEEQDDSDTSDMQMSQSDIDVEGNDKSEQGDEEVEDAVDVQDEDVEVEEEDEEEDEDEEDEAEQAEEGSEIDEISSPPPEQQDESSVPPRLRIKLKLPQASASSSGAPTGVSTPDEVALPTSRRAVPRDVDIESEDEDEEDDDADSSRSTSVGTSAAGRPLTARQAVLANVVGSSHVSLAEAPNPRKKKPLTEIEIALKREETARKRKNLSEKKLQDEKAETINRLLKKQSRSKGKRSALSTADDRPTVSANAMDADAEEVGESIVPTPDAPTMYRWISTSRPQSSPKAAGVKRKNGDEEKHMSLSFSVPVTVFPPPVDALAKESMDVDGPQKEAQTRCDVDGCSAQRKYRLVKHWQQGACGMAHLKLLEAKPA